MLALIWRGGNGDLTALPQKSEPSDARKRDLLPRPSLLTHKHKVKKSSRSGCTHAATACQCGSGWRGSTCRGWLGRKRMASGGRGGGGWGASGRQKHSLNDGTWAGEPAHTRPYDPSAPCVLSLSGNLSTPPSCPWVIARVILSSASSVVSQLWIWPETGSERDVPLHWYRAVSLTHLSQMPPTHPFWCLPSTCEWATVTGGRERQRETERQEGRGWKKGALERAVCFARLTENSPKCWVGIMLSNMDCDFLGEKQPALVNLGWLWNNLDPPPPHIVECQKRNALQQFIAQSHTQSIWNDRPITKFPRFKMPSLFLFLFLFISVSLDQFSVTLCLLHVPMLEQH